MPDCDELAKLARRNARGLRFGDACKLAECWGFVLRRTNGSHRFYKRSGFPMSLNFQPDRNGMAKQYQVKQLLEAIDDLLEQGEASS